MDELINKKWVNRDVFFNKKFPFNQSELLSNLDLASINSYVENVLTHASSGGAKLNSTVFETHQSVIVRIKLPKALHPGNVRLLAQANHLKLKWESSGNHEQIIKLPCSIVSAASKAQFKKSILEVKLPKVKFSERFHEINIRF